jgi:hypothetical protein
LDESPLLSITDQTACRTAENKVEGRSPKCSILTIASKVFKTIEVACEFRP